MRATHPIFGQYDRVPERDLKRALKTLSASGVYVAILASTKPLSVRSLFTVGELRKIGACEVIRQARARGLM